ncbi:MAG: hypothetical protein F4103_07340, partial [Boseongicola sp. SB0673_bin_14]|nr:hypothetical protein [Boseongicola sp. SB0673_bin_14]
MTGRAADPGRLQWSMLSGAALHSAEAWKLFKDQGFASASWSRATRMADPACPSPPFSTFLDHYCLMQDHKISTRSGLPSATSSRRSEVCSKRHALNGLGTDGNAPAHRAGTAATDTSACSPRPARRPGPRSGMFCATANTEEMNRHLREIGGRVSAGRHALVVLDAAGRHGSRELEIPANVFLFLPPHRSPELNPFETLFPVLKHRRFSSRVFESAEHDGETGKDVRNRCTRKTGGIMQVTARAWAVLCSAGSLSS